MILFGDLDRRQTFYEKTMKTERDRRKNEEGRKENAQNRNGEQGKIKKKSMICRENHET